MDVASWLRNKVKPGARPASAMAKAGRVAVIMMHKNEDRLLPFWFAYYAERFGADAITILDNGSDDRRALDHLVAVQDAGATVVYDHVGAECYRNKGMLVLQTIETLRPRGFDFFLPLDCDEFMAVDTEDGPSIDPDRLHAEIDRCRGHRLNHIAGAWVNHPNAPRRFARQRFPKVFGRFTDVAQLGCGYHGVTFRTDPSAISYFHYHCRPYADLAAKASAKVVSHGRGLDTASLKAFVSSKAPGHKSAQELLVGEAGYLAALEHKPYEDRPELAEWFQARFGRQPFDP